MRPLFVLAIASALAVACSMSAQAPQAASAPFEIRTHGRFEEPWAMTFLPDGRLLVTEKQGRLKLCEIDGRSSDVAGVPKVAYGGQGGFGDVVLHPGFADNQLVYLSWAEEGANGLIAAAVGRARLVLDAAGTGSLEKLEVIWRQQPGFDGRGHFGHRIAFGPDGMLYISSGDRQQFDPAQDMSTNLGKILRLRDDGAVPDDNPFAAQGGTAAQVWTLGHRNPLGIAFDAQGRLWELEHGPAGGDELNLIEKGSNYGWPIVSNGDHYDGRPIPDHPTRPEFNAPEVSWTPVIAPGDFIFYSGTRFPQWTGQALIAGMGSKAVVRVVIDGTRAREVERYAMAERIREIEQGPDGSVWLLEDGPGAKLLELVPETGPAPGG